MAILSPSKNSIVVRNETGALLLNTIRTSNSEKLL